MSARSALVGRAVTACAVVLLTGCSAQLGDRGGQEGAPPDEIRDVDHVVVFRNADHFPNIAGVCVEGLGFATTSSGGPALLRLPEWDAECRSRALAPAPGSTPTPSPTTTPSG